ESVVAPAPHETLGRERAGVGRARRETADPPGEHVDDRRRRLRLGGADAELALIVRAPAPERRVAGLRTGVRSAGADLIGGERRRRRELRRNQARLRVADPELTALVATPAPHRAVGLDRAAVARAAGRLRDGGAERVD